MADPDPRADAPPGSDPLAAIKQYREQHYIEPQMLGQLDWLIGEVAQLRALLRRLEWARTGFCPTCSAARGSSHDPGCELFAVLHPEREAGPPPRG